MIKALKQFDTLKADSLAAKTIIAIVDTLRSKVDDRASATKLAKIVLEQLPPNAEAEQALGNDALTIVATFLDRAFKLDTHDHLLKFKEEFLYRTLTEKGEQEIHPDMKSHYRANSVLSNSLPEHVQPETPLSSYLKTVLVNLLPLVTQYIHFIPARLSRIEGSSYLMQQLATMEVANNPKSLDRFENFKLTPIEETRLFNSYELLDHYFLLNKAQASLSSMASMLGAKAQEPVKQVNRAESLPW